MHLKVENMPPWEIWVSESQERMMFTVTPKNVDKVLEICKSWDVEAVSIGKVIAEKRNIVNYHGTEILNLDLEFTTGGPVYKRPYNLPEYNIGNPADLPSYLPMLLVKSHTPTLHVPLSFGSVTLLNMGPETVSPVTPSTFLF